MGSRVVSEPPECRDGDFGSCGRPSLASGPSRQVGNLCPPSSDERVSLCGAGDGGQGTIQAEQPCPSSPKHTLMPGTALPPFPRTAGSQRLSSAPRPQGVCQEPPPGTQWEERGAPLGRQASSRSSS